MASKISKKVSKTGSKPQEGPKTLRILPTEGWLSFMVDAALVTAMFVGVGFILVGLVGMFLDTFSKITIIVDK